VQVHWWVLSHDDLVAKHRVILLREMEMARMAKQALEDEELTSHQTTQTAAPAHSSGQLNSGTVPDELAVNSVDYSCRDNSIVTQPLAPGSAVVAPPPDSAIPVIVRPHDLNNQLTTCPPVTMPLMAAPALINALAVRSDENQSDSDDTILGSYTPNELGTPYVEPPEIEQPDHTANVRILKYIRYHYRGDPVEDLDYPDESPPSDASHFSRRCVEMWDRNGNSMGPTWVTYRRLLMREIPANCSRKSLHWLGVYYPDNQLVQELPIIGSRSSVMTINSRSY
jgi:hypothetical protein